MVYVRFSLPLEAFGHKARRDALTLLIHPIAPFPYFLLEFRFWHCGNLLRAAGQVLADARFGERGSAVLNVDRTFSDTFSAAIQPRPRSCAATAELQRANPIPWQDKKDFRVTSDRNRRR